jgi:hypothetical protein
LRETGEKWSRPDSRRPIDIGYRGRRPPAAWGGAAQEKYEIAGEFQRRAQDLDLVLDIETDESKRIYGRAWPRFIGRCKAVLGTESGAAITNPLDGRDVPYRTISPRHFEAAALRSCQILYEGRYSGILEPMTHYIPLRKDFSNLDEVITAFRSPRLRHELTGNAHRDLVASERLTYGGFIRGFDAELEAAGLRPTAGAAANRSIARALYPPKPLRTARRSWRALRVGFRVIRSSVEERLRPSAGSER